MKSRLNIDVIANRILAVQTMSAQSIEQLVSDLRSFGIIVNRHDVEVISRESYDDVLHWIEEKIESTSAERESDEAQLAVETKNKISGMGGADYLEKFVDGIISGKFTHDDVDNLLNLLNENAASKISKDSLLLAVAYTEKSRQHDSGVETLLQMSKSNGYSGVEAIIVAYREGDEVKDPKCLISAIRNKIGTATSKWKALSLIEKMHSSVSTKLFADDLMDVASEDKEKRLSLLDALSYARESISRMDGNHCTRVDSAKHIEGGTLHHVEEMAIGSNDDPSAHRGVLHKEEREASQLNKIVDKILSGKVPLVKIYWLYCVAVNSILALILHTIDDQISTDGLALFILTASLYNVVCFTGVWKSANNYTGPKVWVVLSKLAVILGCISLAFNAILILSIIKASQ